MVDTSDLASQLTQALGTTTVSALGGAHDPGAATGWSEAGADPGVQVHHRLELAHRVLLGICHTRSPDEARLWFSGDNPICGSPVEAIRGGRDREVIRAYSALVNEDWVG